MAPVKEGYIKYTDLLDGSLTIFDVEKMNESISYYVKLHAIINEQEPKTNNKNGRKIR